MPHSIRNSDGRPLGKYRLLLIGPKGAICAVSIQGHAPEHTKRMGTYKDSEVLSYSQGQVCHSCEQQFEVLWEFIFFIPTPSLACSFHFTAQLKVWAKLSSFSAKIITPLFMVPTSPSTIAFNEGHCPAPDILSFYNLPSPSPT